MIELILQVLFPIFITPLSVFCKPKISFVKMVLPDPLGPRITVIPLEEKLKERFSNIFLFLIFKNILSTVIIFFWLIIRISRWQTVDDKS